MTIRAKMILESVIPYSYGGSQAIFRCSYDGTKSAEDVGFQKATPSGEARFQIDNPDALGQMIIGEAYYFDITRVRAPQNLTLTASDGVTVKSQVGG